jgi:hypothetical protein
MSDPATEIPSFTGRGSGRCAAGRKIPEDRRHHAVGHVGGEVELHVLELLFAIFRFVAHDDAPVPRVHRHIERPPEGWTVLHEVVAEQPERRLLRIHRGFIVQRSIRKTKDQPNRDLRLSNSLHEIAARENLAVEIF